MILFANGESHTAGTNPESNSFYNYDLAWPRWVAEDIGADYINISEPGSSIEQISRTTIIQVGKLIKQVDLKDLLVTVLWAGIKRYEFWSDAERRHQSISLKTTWKPEQKVMDYIQKRSELESENYTYYKDLYHMYTTALALESYGVKYVFLNARTMLTPQEFVDTPELTIEYNELYSLYGNRKDYHIGFCNKEETFKEQLKDYSTIAGSSYWGVDGQKAYARFVQKRLDFNQIVPYNRC